MFTVGSIRTAMSRRNPVLEDGVVLFLKNGGLSELRGILKIVHFYYN
jgi:hypothetical protein